ncbi:GNAT family N-acetyltransferase [Bacillus sp. 1P06AnD]|uniref:GNAT family N-acetyltransferase n=1 Tax=Bacillus sp. 1P06AnD TaxID=3132208 RepID=UPI00399F3A84
MKDGMHLVRPSLHLRTAYISYFEEWAATGESMIPAASACDPSDFRAFIEKIQNAEKGVGIPEHWVTDSMFWLMDEHEGIIGIICIRHSLTIPLLNTGGHIGYGIRPSQRKKRYATYMLHLALEEAKKLGLPKVLITCDAANTGSEKVIRSNGGQEDHPFIEENGNIVKRFWIDLKEENAWPKA